MPKIMTSIHNALLLAAIAVTAAAAPALADPRAEQRAFMASLSDAYALPGLYTARIIRDGYRKYDGVDQYQQVDRDNAGVIVLTAGKRFALKDRLRLQATVEYGSAKVRDEGYQIAGFDMPIPATLYSTYEFYGAQLDAHRIFHTSYSRTYYLSAGAGLYMTGHTESREVTWGAEVYYEGEKSWTFSPGANLGIGTEYRVGRKWGMALSYNFRVMKSQDREEFDLMFPTGAEYREFFYSHMLQLQVLLPELGKKKTVIMD